MWVTVGHLPGEWVRCLKGWRKKGEKDKKKVATAQHFWLRVGGESKRQNDLF